MTWKRSFSRRFNVEYTWNVGKVFLIIIDKFNAKYGKWWFDDITTMEGIKLDNLSSQYELKQILKKLSQISRS